MVIPILAISFQCRKRHEVCCNRQIALRKITPHSRFNAASGMRSVATLYLKILVIILYCFNAASGMRSVATQEHDNYLQSSTNSFNAASGMRSVATLNTPYQGAFVSTEFQCRKRHEVCCNTVSWKPHEHWPKNEVLDNLHEKAPI